MAVSHPTSWPQTVEGLCLYHAVSQRVADREHTLFTIQAKQRQDCYLLATGPTHEEAMTTLSLVIFQSFLWPKRFLYGFSAQNVNH